ncbi:MAG: site-2 protease family protein [Halanaerobiales bacterium]
MQLQQIIILLPVLLLSLSLHEYSHGLVSHKLGDPTPEVNGRLTLNPLPHLDLFGSLFMIISLLNGVGIGWAKPVPINPRNYKNPRRGLMLVSVAGPGSNFILALIFTMLIRMILYINQASIYIGSNSFYFRNINSELISSTLGIFILAVSINITLGLFNLLPVPPLDGSKILRGILPPRFDKYIHKLEGPMGMMLLLLLAFTGLFRHVLLPLVNFFLRYLLI